MSATPAVPPKVVAPTVEQINSDRITEVSQNVKPRL